jgi:hypothetical protein
VHIAHALVRRNQNPFYPEYQQYPALQGQRACAFFARRNRPSLSLNQILSGMVSIMFALDTVRVPEPLPPFFDLQSYSTELCCIDVLFIFSFKVFCLFADFIFSSPAVSNINTIPVKYTLPPISSLAAVKSNRILSPLFVLRLLLLLRTLLLKLFQHLLLLAQYPPVDLCTNPNK